jgi:hypothetical protein
MEFNIKIRRFELNINYVYISLVDWVVFRVTLCQKEKNNVRSIFFKRLGLKKKAQNIRNQPKLF